jgi:ribosomal protein S18 acetylase RimI-like enzyme
VFFIIKHKAWWLRRLPMLEYRPLVKTDDFSDLLSLSREFFNEYESYHKEFFKIDHLSNDDIIAYFSAFCDSESRRAFIALTGKKIVGYITFYIKDQADYWMIKQVGEISGLMVDSRFRQRGIGRELMNHARKFFASHGVKYYTLYTSVENIDALKFYSNYGLVPLYSTLVGES